MRFPRPSCLPMSSDFQVAAATEAAAADRISSPSITVMVRSMQRSSLMPALGSVAAQRVDVRVEVLVVNAAGGHHPPLEAACGAFALRLLNQDGPPLDRPVAANLAIDQASGDWLLFLDDDDLLDADHLARLGDALARHPEAAAAYAGVRLTDAEGRTTGELDEPFDDDRLWLANFLPIHAVLFRRAAQRQRGVRFDESLPVYEDWDFWRQLSRGQAFVHVPGVSATYRLIGSSGLSAAQEQVARDGRARIYRKWLPRLTASELTRIATAAEVHRAREAELVTGQVQLVQQLALAGAQRQQVEQALEQTQRAHDAEQAAWQAEADRTRRYTQQLTDELALARADYQRLEQGYQGLERAWKALTHVHQQVIGSLSWRVTAPLRTVRAALSRDGLRSLSARVARRLIAALPLTQASKQRAKVWLATHPVGARVLRWLLPPPAPAVAGSGVVPPPPVLDKEQVRAQAEAELSTMLAGDERLDLRCRASRPRVSVVIVLYNQAGLSLLCLRALAASRGVDFETLIVDNASTDRVPQLLERVDGVRLLRQQSNLGFLRAVNLAAEQARGEHLLLLNNDAVVEPETLARAVSRLDAEPDAGAAGGPILLWDGRLQEAGSIIWRDGSCQGYGRGDDPDAPEYRFVRDVDYCSGAFLMVRRALFERLGRFDDAYAPAYYEESDFCVRLWEGGHRVVYDPAVRVKHFEFASDQGSGQAIALQQRNRARFVEQHPAFLARQAMPPDGVWMARQRKRAGALRVLMIDDRVPLPSFGQGYPRASSLASCIADAGHLVTYYPLQFPHEDWAHVGHALPAGVEVILGRGLAGIADFLTERSSGYDAVIVSRPHNMDVMNALLQRQPQLLQGCRMIYDAEALFSLRDIAKAQVLGQPMTADEQQRLVEAELAIARRADTVVTVSEPEARRFRESGFGDVHVLGHAIVPRPIIPPFEQRSGFVFVGALPADDSPNADSLLWFARQVWPAIQQALGPSARLDIVGSCESPAVQALAGPSIRVRGRVADLDPVYDSARVFVVPTRYAAGIPHKAHEAAAHGLPMVVSSLIGEQLGWGADVLQAGDAEAFAAQCIHLHSDPASWALASARQLERLRHDCSPVHFGAVVAALLRPLGDRPGTPDAG